jgi:hypothetical protein
MIVRSTAQHGAAHWVVERRGLDRPENAPERLGIELSAIAVDVVTGAHLRIASVRQERFTRERPRQDEGRGLALLDGVMAEEPQVVVPSIAGPASASAPAENRMLEEAQRAALAAGDGRVLLRDEIAVTLPLVSVLEALGPSARRVRR